MHAILFELAALQPAKKAKEHAGQLDRAAALAKTDLPKALARYAAIVLELGHADAGMHDQDFRARKDTAQSEFATRLRTLLQVVLRWQRGQAEGDRVHKVNLKAAALALYTILEAAWPAYSGAYYGVLRQDYHRKDLIREIISQRPPVETASPEEKTSAEPQRMPAAAEDLLNVEDLLALLADDDTATATPTQEQTQPQPQAEQQPTTGMAATEATIADPLAELLRELEQDTPSVKQAKVDILLRELLART